MLMSLKNKLLKKIKRRSDSRAFKRLALQGDSGKKIEAQLFERKFLDYRNKMKELYHQAEADSPLRENIRSFL